MIVRRFDHTIDTATIEAWLTARDMSLTLAADLPHLGYIACSEEGKPVAAGFIRACEGKHGIADSFITNPDEAPSTRDTAMDMVLTKVLEAAKELKLNSLIAYTLDANTLLRSKRHGFKEQPFTVLTMDLKEIK